MYVHVYMYLYLPPVPRPGGTNVGASGAWRTEKLLCIRTPYSDTHLNTRMYMYMHTDTFGVDTGGCGREEVA